MPNRTIKKEIVEFLNESNAIEGVYDDVSLNQALEAWNYLKKQPELTVGIILKTHKILMLHQKLQPDEKGYFRRCEVTIGGRRGFNWVKIPEEIKEWLVKMNATQITKSAYYAKEMHIEYERIHPFVDGNGRTGRMFLNWHLIKMGFPILIIKSDERLDYYKWFK